MSYSYTSKFDDASGVHDELVTHEANAKAALGPNVRLLGTTNAAIGVADSNGNPTGHRFEVTSRWEVAPPPATVEGQS